MLPSGHDCQLIDSAVHTASLPWGNPCHNTAGSHENGDTPAALSPFDCHVAVLIYVRFTGDTCCLESGDFVCACGEIISNLHCQLQRVKFTSAKSVQPMQHFASVLAAVQIHLSAYAASCMPMHLGRPVRGRNLERVPLTLPYIRTAYVECSLSIMRGLPAG